MNDHLPHRTDSPLTQGPRPHRLHHRKWGSKIVSDNLPPPSGPQCCTVESGRGASPPYASTLRRFKMAVPYCLNSTVTSLGVVQVATSSATPTPRSLDTQLMLFTRYLIGRHATLRTTQLQCTRRAVIRVNRPIESVQALVATCPLALLHGRQSFRCSSQIHTCGIDFGVRYQCCHGWTICNSPHTAHFTTLTYTKPPDTTSCKICSCSLFADNRPLRQECSILHILDLHLHRKCDIASWPSPPVAGLAHVLSMGGLSGYYVTPLPVMAVVAFPNVAHDC